MVQIGLTGTARDLEQILALQRLNHVTAVKAQDRDSDGFVTMEYDIAALARISGRYRHVVAREDANVIGYALVMLPEYGGDFPMLADMFAEIDSAVFGGAPVKSRPYFVMGQVCVAREFRGHGVFRALYRGLKAQMSGDFELVATEISKQNARSAIAHERMGFRPIHDAGRENPLWDVIAWDWREPDQR